MARYLIDVNLPRKISHWNSSDFQLLDPRLSDLDIWDYALKHELTIVTRDADFVDRVMMPGAGPSVIHFRTGNMKLSDFRRFIQNHWTEICRRSDNNRLVVVFEDRIDCVS